MELSMSVKRIVDNIYAISLGVVNAFLIEHDGWTIVDTGYPGSDDKILQALRELGAAPEAVKHILVTHCHADHTGSLAALKESTGAPAYMHPEDAALIVTGQTMRPFKPAPGLFRLLAPLVVSRSSPPQTVEAADIENEVLDGDELDIAGGLRVIHIPGHTVGQVAFFSPQHGGVLFAGDAAANFLSLGYAPIYEDLEEGKRSLAKIATLDFQVACFGHGRAITSGASARFQAKWG
jgi:glyoxylase-like metal-dependent hydrolase (beta-lactamase superfamily II)